MGKPNRSSSPKKKRHIEQLPKHYRWAAALFLVGGYLHFHGWYYHSHRSESWLLAEASIRNIAIEEGICLGYKEINFASIRFDFSYEVSSKTYNQYFFSCAWDRARAEKILADLKAGTHLAPDEPTRGRVAQATSADIFPVRYNPANPENFALNAGDPPSAKWNFFAALFLLPTFPFVILVPVWNLIIALLSSEGRQKGFFSICRSVIPLFYRSKLEELMRRAVKDAGMTKARYHYWSRNSESETGGVINLVFNSDEDLNIAKSSGWLKALNANFEAHRRSSALPLFAEERFGIAVHSDDEIRRTGEYDYWK